MDILSRYKIISRNRFERILFDLEVQLGATRRRAANIQTRAQLPLVELDNITMKCNQLVTSIAYQERSQVFIRDLAARVHAELLAQITSGNLSNTEQLKLKNASYEISDIADNCYDLARNTVHQVSCLEKRAHTLINVVGVTIRIPSKADSYLDLYHGCAKGQPYVIRARYRCEKRQFYSHCHCYCDDDILTSDIHHGMFCASLSSIAVH